MKKYGLIGIGVISMLLIAIAILLVIQSKPKIVSYKKDEVIERFNNQESFLLVIGISTCTDCAKYKKTTLVEYISKEREFPLVFLYTDQGNFLGKKDLSNFLIDYGLTLGGTPTTYLVINGRVVNSIEDPIDLKTLEMFIEENKIK